MSLGLLEGFHGHLGPYVVLGYKMGFVANLKLDRDPFKKKALSLTGSKPPISCMMDGVQLSSGCTLGKGNITVEDRGQPRIIFSNMDGSRTVDIRLRAEIKDIIDRVETKDKAEELARELFNMTDEELFEVHES